MKLKKITTTIGVMLLVICLLSVTAMASSETLKRGDKGSKVKELQDLLIKQGIFNYSEATGYYGKITEDAIKTFQNSAGLKADGIVGEMTWEKLKSQEEVSEAIDNADTTQNVSELFTGPISKGMEGEQVEKIQKRLQELGIYEYSRITGYYGSITKDAVEDFQRAYGLKEDGVVGEKTMEKLFSTYKETSLIPGMKSDEVGEIQKRLKELGYYSYDIDNDYGAKTREAVVYFQSAHDLKADGIAGEQTKKVLFSDGAKKEQDARRESADNHDSNPPAEPTPPQSSEGKSKAEQAIDIAKTKLGCKYVYGSQGPDTFDCSGLTTYVYSKLGVSLPRTAYNQGYDQYGIKITDPDSLKPGDLVFFNTNNSDGDLSDHAGIYIGNGDFIHANSGSAMSVVISNLNTSAFYKAAFSWGRRVF
jgi:peptidoglycan hydrolase-like protein with peptidoglycan-binding domain